MGTNKWADTNALANVATGLAICSMVPFFFGMVDTNIGCIPWMLCALPFVIIAVIGCFINGDVVGGTANAILTGICLFGNLYQALITLITSYHGMPDNLRQALVMGDGAAYLGSAVFCGSVAWLAWKANKAQSIAVIFPTVAFFLLFLMQMGIAGPFGVIPGTCFTIFATWLIYSGIAIMIHQATGHQLLPYILASNIKEVGK